MKDAKQRAKSDTVVPSGRGTYAKQACSHCRKRKSKCDGRAPVCGPCEKAGRASECTWGKETAKKARTQQHFESLENYIRALEAKVKDLQADLEYCRKQHGGPPNAHSPSDSLEVAAASIVPRQDSSEPEVSSDNEGGGSTSGESGIENLISPTRHLVLQDTDLEYHGPTSVWRLGAQRASPAASDAKKSTSPEPPNSSTSSTYFDWSRYLPPEVPLSRQEHDRLLEILCKFNMCWGLRIIPELFLRDMHRALSVPPTPQPPRSAHYSPMLHNAALALACSYSDDPVLKDIRSRRLFATRAKKYIEGECQKPTIALVTALGTLALFHSVCGEQSLGYLYFGMAGRMSQSLGLKIDCSPWVKQGLITQEDMLDRNWSYWTIFNQDILWSLYVGRECCVTPHPKDAQFPVPFVGSEVDTAPWYWAPSKLPPQPSNVVKCFEATCDLMVIARRIFDFVWVSLWISGVFPQTINVLLSNGLGPGSKRESTLQTVSELDIQLNNWKDSLPPDVDLTAASRPSALPHRLMLHLAYWWLLLLLHRPFYRRAKSGSTGPDIDHVKLRNRASDNIMLLLGIWNEKYSLRYVPITLMQVAYCAGTAFVLSAVQATSGPRLGRVALSSALTQAEQCIRYLLISGQSFECANHVASILSNLLHDQLRPRLLMRTLEPKDLVTSGPGQDREHGEHPPYSPSSEGGLTAVTAEGADCFSLATTISSLDALRNQCRNTAAAHSYSPDWNPQEGFPLPGLVQPQPPSASSSGAVGTNAGYNNGQFQLDFSQLSRIPEDVEMEWGGIGVGMDLGIMGGQPLSNRPYMAFDIPELSAAVRVGPDATFADVDAPPFDPQMLRQSAPSTAPARTPQSAATALAQGMQLDFNQDELAVMDQLMHQQMRQNLAFQSTRYHGM
ncbi:hypothetical protein BD309DRAFT_1080110 [Dichomitus squalens]|nr:hypothetical protein BD309DRAFT_1080110 [Dichomitus squalens]